MAVGLLGGGCVAPEVSDGGVAPSSHGFTLGPERDLGVPVVWPVGEGPTLAETAEGALVGLVFGGRGLVMPLSPDGQSGPATEVGSAVTGVRVTPTAAGILASFSPARDVITSQLFEPATGLPLAALVELPRMQNLGRWWVTGEPGRVLLAAQVMGNPDGGWRGLARPLTDDGRVVDSSPPVEVTAWGNLVELHTGLGSHWAIFSAVAADGGTDYPLARLADDGSPTAVALLPATSTPVFTTTASRLFFAWLHEPAGAIEYTFLTPSGVTTRRDAWPQACRSLTVAGQGEDVWATCVSADHALVRLVFSESAAPVSAQLLASDGGALVAGPVATRQPVQLVQRQFQEVGRGNHRATHAFPLEASGRALTGPARPMLLRGSAQFDVGFASAGPTGPHALVWYDDEQLPRLPMLRTTFFSSTGEPAGAARWLPGLTLFDFMSGFELQRTVAGNERGFLLVVSNGLDVNAVTWPTDAGPPAAVTVTTTPGTRSVATVCGDDAGFVATWAQLRPRQAQRFDVNSQRVGAVTPLGDAPMGELVCGGDQLLLARGWDTLSLDWLSRDLSRLDGGTRALSDEAPWVVRTAHDEAVAMVAWETPEPQNRALRRVWASRLWLDGGAALDEVPLSIEVYAGETGVALRDVRVAGGHFLLAGRELSDAGSALWLWRVPTQAAPEEPRALLSEVHDVSEVAVGPELEDGGVLLAYARAHPELGPLGSRVHYRILGTQAEPTTGHPPLLLAVGCTIGGDGLASGSLLWAALAVLARARRTRSGVARRGRAW